VANSISAKKRIRQNEKANARNRARKHDVKLAIRNFDESLGSGDAAKTAEALRAAIKKVDQVAAKGALHKKTAARRKAKLQRSFNALAGAKS
jgi:small subunit ribosomal protein S20